MERYEIMIKKYDFETTISKKGQGSYKWEQMYKVSPDVEEGIVPLSVADMELKIAPEITEGIKKYLDEAIPGYTGTYENYYKAVTGWMERRHGFQIEKEWIVTSPGVVSAIYDCVKAYTEEGEGVITFTPVYYPFYSAIKDNGRKLVQCELINNDGYYEIDFEKFEELAKEEDNRLFILCSPHNPVGRVWKKEELEKIGEIALRNNLIIVSDEIHSDIVMPGKKHFILQMLSEELSEITVTCTAPTKSFNLAGIGISNIIIKNSRLRKKFSAEQGKSASHVFAALGYKACELAYTKGEEWFDEFILLIDKNQKMVNQFFENKFVNIKAPLIEGTYLQWIDFRALSMRKEELKKFFNEKLKVFMSEGYTFGEGGDGFERMNLAAPSKVIEKALENIYSGIKIHYPQFCKEKS